MENHPIPQDVTGFQFKLIGNMTVKQFAYVAVGVVMSVIFYYSPLFFLIKLPFIILFSVVGISLAFLPLDGRPLDVMLSQFLKALFLPNQYLYTKMGVDLSFSFPIHTQKKVAAPQPEDDRRKKLLAQMMTKKSRGNTKIDDKEGSFLSSLFSDGQNQPSHTGNISQLDTNTPSEPIIPVLYPTPQKPADPALTHDPEKIEEILKAEAEKAKKAMEEIKQVEENPQSTPEESADAHSRFLALQKQLDEILTQKNQLEEQIKEMQKSRNVTPAQETYTPQTDSNESDEHIKKISPLTARSKGILHTPDRANVIVGVIHDPRGNILPHILVEIKDQDGSPVRAFKTNELGQFASATPLANGVYTIIFEDPQGKQQFDTIELIANGEILSPMEVVSHDAREELRRALFS